MAETIVAIATPIGRSGIGVIRLSGTDALLIAQKLGASQLRPRVATLTELREPATHEVIDKAVVTFFQAPHSFTGDDVVEISCHGSPVLLRQVIDICLREGARMAEPGEFTLCALANGRIDLAEAEAIRDLIDAQTTASAKQAVRQMRGEFSHQLQPIKDELLDVIVVLESALEFVEDDLPETQTRSVIDRLNKIALDIDAIAATYKAGKLIRDGLRVALVGRPNVGKSSLFNALLGSDRAIVTEIPGTTRDQIHERFTINDIPISLIDTAGLRETTDLVESLGVERSRRTMADADIILVLLDAADEFNDEDARIIESVMELDHLIVLNKIDIAIGKAIVSTGSRAPQIRVSAMTGEGLDKLQAAMIEPFAPTEFVANGFLVSDARHFDLLVRSGDEIASSIALMEGNTSEEIVLVGLHNALRFLGEITGETTTEDMLTRIFSTFCIGK